MTVLTGPWRCPAASTSLVLDPLVSGIHTVAPPSSVPEFVPPAAQTSWRRPSSPARSARGLRGRPGPSAVKAARAAAAIELTEDEERELRAVLRTPSASQQQALRGRIVLRAAQGASNTQI